VKLPEFDGSQNIEGFLVVFELGCEAMGMDPLTMKASLASKLTGSAAAWLQG
jgi:hypothetical protein